MIIPTRMIQLIAVVLESDVEAVTRALIEAGTVDFIDTRKVVEESSLPLEGMGEAVPLHAIRDEIGRVESLLPVEYRKPNSSAILDVSKIAELDIEKLKSRFDRINKAIEVESTIQRESGDEIERLADMRKQIELFGSVEVGLKNASRFSYLAMQTGSVDTKMVERLREAMLAFPSVVVETRADDERTYLFLVSLKRDEKQIDEILDRFAWDDVDLGRDIDAIDEKVGTSVNERIVELEAKRDKAAGKVKQITEEHRDELFEIWEILKVNEVFAKVRTNFSRTQRTIILSGWLPEDSVDSVGSRVHAVCEDGCYLEWRKPTDEQIHTTPVEMKNPKFLAPFELLVRNYSVPAYGTIDPTPLVAISYLVMFGLMFGDAGHGAILAACGIIGRLLVKKEGAVRKLLTLLIWCGGAAVVTGILFGSYFGMQWFPPVWFDYHGVVSGHGGGDLVNNIYDVLAITVYFGVTIIGLGLVLNWVNLTMKKRWFDLAFDKAGVLGGLIYGTGVWAATYFVRHDYKQLPSGGVLAICIGIPVLILACKAPLEYMKKRREGRTGRFHLLQAVDFFMEWIVEILEVFSGYLANTLSFMRVAGLGIAHEALMIAFFSIARMVGNGKITFLSIIILVFGNLLVILLEGLSAGIQSLRLNYYEFFSKYFTSAGRVYHPVSLRID